MMEPIVVLVARRCAVVGMCALALFVSSCGSADEAPDADLVAVFTHSCAGLVCEFDGSPSTDSAGDVVGWHWSFGDGASSTSQNPSHAYTEVGTFEATLTVKGHSGGWARRLEQLTLEESQPADTGRATVELAFGAHQAGRYSTNWTHEDPGLSVTIGDGWWVTDTLTSVSLGPLTERGSELCDPLARIVVLQGIYDAVEQKMMPVGDLTETLQADAPINVGAVSPAEVGGYSATRIDGTINLDQVELGWRFCGFGVRMFVFGSSDLNDPSYRWVWLPALTNLSFWVVPVEASDVLIAVSYEDPEQRVVDEVEAVVASLEIHPPREPVKTRTLHTQFGPIEVFNGTAKLHSLVDWLVGRFVESGMGSPGVSEVVFAATEKCHERGYAGGFTEVAEAGSHVWLCFGEERVDSLARPTLLHEFAHAWSATQIDEETQTRFLALFGLATWYPSGFGLPQVGVEYAADVIVWGLLEEPGLPARFSDLSCEVVGSGFRLLTGAEPLTDPASCDR